MPKTAKRMKRKPVAKADAQQKHAIRRAYERYGLELNKNLYLSLCKRIQDGDAVFLGRQSNRLTVWKITVPQTTDFGDPGTVTSNVVYDSHRHRIVTFLPEGITEAKGVSLLVDGEFGADEAT